MGSPLSYDLADLVPLTINITDANGVLANASAVSLTITQPDGTFAVPSVTNPSPGVYLCDYPPVMPGPHLVRWVASGTNASGFSDTFDVREATPPYIVSLVDAKQFLNITSTANDEELRSFVEAATQMVENVVGPVLLRPVTEVHTRPGQVLVLKQPPAIALVSVTAIQTSGVFTRTQVYDVSLLDLDPDTGIVRRLDGLPLGCRRAGLPPSPLRVGYTAGRRMVPGSITMAARVVINHLWATQRGHFEGLRPAPGGGPNAPKKGKGTKDTIPHLALELLQPYRQPYPIM